MRHELQYAQGHERKTNIVEADSAVEADQAADLFLAGRTMISFHSLHLPTTVLQPKPEFIPIYEAN